MCIYIYIVLEGSFCIIGWERQWEKRLGLEYELYNIEWIVYVCGDCLFLQTVRSTSFINSCSLTQFFSLYLLFLHKKINHMKVINMWFGVFCFVFLN